MKLTMLQRFNDNSVDSCSVLFQSNIFNFVSVLLWFIVCCGWQSKRNWMAPVVFMSSETTLTAHFRWRIAYYFPHKQGIHSQYSISPCNTL